MCSTMWFINKVNVFKNVLIKVKDTFHIVNVTKLTDLT